MSSYHYQYFKSNKFRDKKILNPILTHDCRGLFCNSFDNFYLIEQVSPDDPQHHQLVSRTIQTDEHEDETFRPR